MVLDHSEYLRGNGWVCCFVWMPAQLQTAEVVLEQLRLLHMPFDLPIDLVHHLLDCRVRARHHPRGALGANKQVLLEQHLALGDKTFRRVDIRELLGAILAGVAVGRNATADPQVLFQTRLPFADKPAIHSIPICEGLGTVLAAEVVSRALGADSSMFHEVLVAIVQELTIFVIFVGGAPGAMFATVNIGRVLGADHHVRAVAGVAVTLEAPISVDVLEPLAAMRAHKVVLRILRAHTHVLCKLNP
eukprot:CAMPEP_0171070712 /NCGR_PEP_ID=MMETSP0766_2-20121228/9913_1 /TAXON_ID=439317 /ORGANISM="Gambierdiscus australes, Strain CAWD 149" /LENGTH=245 /DNA_ID=CAMNT_0011527219 /DNA_START=45 /DNA_END=779 /DNA_ORIENTATION=+